MDKYLETSAYINWQEPSVYAQAIDLSTGVTGRDKVIQRCFEFVRDEIKHSLDHQLYPVTCKASDVLKHGTGYCYAKSHLLAALLRANKIPAGLCYQRLTAMDDQPPFCLHGLNAVYLEKHGWYRLDARGNKPGVNAGFCPPIEKLAYPIITEGEADLPEVWPSPLPVIIETLKKYKTYHEVAENLPDIALLKCS